MQYIFFYTQMFHSLFFPYLKKVTHSHDTTTFFRPIDSLSLELSTASLGLLMVHVAVQGCLPAFQPIPTIAVGLGFYITHLEGLCGERWWFASKYCIFCNVQHTVDLQCYTSTKNCHVQVLSLCYHGGHVLHLSVFRTASRGHVKVHGSFEIHVEVHDHYCYRLLWAFCSAIDASRLIVEDKRHWKIL